jgi:hypothetical protein
MVQAVLRTRAVTPVITTTVNLDGSRFVTGRWSEAQLSPMHSKVTTRGYADRSNSLWTGDCPPTDSIFQRGPRFSKGRMAKTGFWDDHRISDKSPAGPVRTACGAGVPQIEEKTVRVFSSIHNSPLARAGAALPIHFPRISSNSTDSTRDGKGVTRA